MGGYETREISVGERPIYVTGHRNPDIDSIAAAIGYAELLSRVDRDTDYVPVRLGDVNAQTEWALEQSGAAMPDYLRHVMLRVKDVMRERVPDRPPRRAGPRGRDHDGPRRPRHRPDRRRRRRAWSG